jgi:hypothetical protein
LCLILLIQAQAQAQSVIDMTAMKGLAPASTLANTPEGRIALAANYTITGGIQTSEIRQPTLLPLGEQRQQALRDAFSTEGDLAQLADGLGTTLGAAYLAHAHYLGQKHFTSISLKVAEVITYANATSATNSSFCKYFFANETIDGRTPASPEAKAILKNIGGHPDAFGINYGLPAGAPGAGTYGNARPFQTVPHTVDFVGLDYFDVLAGNAVYNRGPIANLMNSPSYPSGHAAYGYTGSLVLAMLVPERYRQMVARGAEYGNGRVLMGAHYAMDVIAGRTLAMYDLAHLLADDPAYTGHSFHRAHAIDDFRSAMKAAQGDLKSVLQAACGNQIEVCAREDNGRFSGMTEDAAFYASTQTYDLPVVYPQYARTVEDVGTLAPEAGYLLTTAFPALTLEQADRILTETEGPGGGFLDNGSSFGIYSRLNLYAAAAVAAQLANAK